MREQAPILQIYLATVPGEMEGERAILEEFILPELSLRAGIKIILVEPERDGKTWDLAKRFQEIDRCRPFFLAFLGEWYGDPPVTVSSDLIASHPWVADVMDHSVLELEIRHAVLQDLGRVTASLFYFRDQRCRSRIPDRHNLQFPPEPLLATERLAKLKNRIRDSGRPVLDGYSCVWSEASARGTELLTFKEILIKDLWGVIQDWMDYDRDPSDGGLTEDATGVVAPEKPLPLHENVQFTVYRPKIVEPMKWVPLLAFAHLEELPSNAAPGEPDPIEEVKAQAQSLLGDQAKNYTDIKQDSFYTIPDEAEITFLPEIPGFDVNPPRRTFLWQESVHREEFRIRSSPRLDGQTIRGRVSVFSGSILLAELSLGIRVDSRLAGISTSAERAASRPFRNIFASYSHRDSRIVEEFERYAAALGDRYLRDVYELRAGERWNDRLKRMIDQADVFQLFWSWNAMTSPYVEEEWRYALSLRRPRFVRPTYWDDPLPTLPERGLPPEELASLHFQRLTFCLGLPSQQTAQLESTILASESGPTEMVAAPLTTENSSVTPPSARVLPPALSIPSLKLWVPTAALIVCVAYGFAVYQWRVGAEKQSEPNRPPQQPVVNIVQTEPEPKSEPVPWSPGNLPRPHRNPPSSVLTQEPSTNQEPPQPVSPSLPIVTTDSPDVTIPDEIDIASSSGIDRFREIEGLVVNIARLSEQAINAHAEEGGEEGDELFQRLADFSQAATETRRVFRKTTGTGLRGTLSRFKQDPNNLRGTRDLEIKVQDLGRLAEDIDRLIHSSSPITQDRWREIKGNLDKLKEQF